jgi:TetR/AcrR family transcriptional repressor of nem operon
VKIILDCSFQNAYLDPMARIKEFDRDKALESAVGVFREHGFDGTSTEMLVQAMKIGRQSLYDTFGDKWALYRLPVECYASAETEAHIRELRSNKRAIDGISAMMDRVVAEADRACLGVNSICEFGQSRPDLTQVHHAADHRLRHAARVCIRQAQDAGDLDRSVSADAVIDFIIASIAGIRIAARGGAGQETLHSLGQLALRALMPR